MQTPIRPLDSLIERIHKKWLKRALFVTNGDQIKAARFLGVSTRTVYNWMKRFGLK